ncbi:Uncharacterised protein [uncultured archaeon]|nr:Uncharacterised protein [uncultured archaeon]
MALELVKCPHCGYEFRTDIGEQEKDGETVAVRSILNFWKPKPKRIKTIDIECPNPNCRKTFEYPVEP